jgi:hypothetical protein
MIIPVSTSLARAKRKKQPVLFCSADSLDIALTIIQVATSHSKPLVLSLDTTVSSALPASLFIKTIVDLAQDSPVEIGLSVQVPATEEAVKQALDLGVQSLIPTFSVGHSLDQMATSLRSLEKIARKKDAELIGYLSSAHPIEQVVRFIHESGIQTLLLPIVAEQSSRALFSSAYVSELTKACKIPLITCNQMVTIERLERAHKLGIQGFLLKELLAQAYTAGLRTGLRNRSAYQPAGYERYAFKAVEKTISYYLHITSH